jgi:acyl transferase domain-containing protein/acyl carrier protein
VSDILKIPVDELDVTENWIDFGFDSVTLTELAAELTKHFGLDINPVQFYGYPTIESIANHLLVEHKEALDAVYAREVSPVSRRQMQPEARPPLPTIASPGTPEPIAIIGLSGRFPKSRSVDEMWRLLADGQDAVEEIPADRFDWRLIYGNPTEDGSKTNGKWCGCLPGVHEFDPLFFEISPREAEAMDPRQRLLLMEAWKALEDAGYGSLHLQQGKVGMFVGVESNEHAIPAGKNAGITANHDAILAARLAYFLNLRGPNIAINTACSSGLVATHLACQSLRNQECDTAIAAGVNVLLKPDAFVLMGQAGMLSSDGKSFAFDKRANGIVPAEAVVAVVLKRLSEAESDGDPIYAVIRGSGINYDGKTNGITAPSGVSQTELMTDTYNRCGISPDEIDYIVTLRTATQLGDPIEVNALFDAFKGQTQNKLLCAHFEQAKFQPPWQRLDY